MIKLNEVLTPNEIQAAVDKFERPLKGQLSGPVKDYVDSLKHLAQYLSANPHKNSTQAKDYLASVMHDKNLKQGKPSPSNPEQPSEPVPFGSPAAKSFQQGGSLPSLSALAGKADNDTQPWHKQAGLPSFSDNEPKPDSYVDLKGTRQLTTPQKKSPVKKAATKKPVIAKSDAVPPPLKKEPSSTPVAAPKAAEPVAKTAAPKKKVAKPKNDLPDATRFAKLVEPEKQQSASPKKKKAQAKPKAQAPSKSNDDDEDGSTLPSMQNIARAQRLVK
jgi:hypothetical protein